MIANTGWEEWEANGSLREIARLLPDGHDTLDRSSNKDARNRGGRGASRFTCQRVTERNASRAIVLFPRIASDPMSLSLSKNRLKMENW